VLHDRLGIINVRWVSRGWRRVEGVTGPVCRLFPPIGGMSHRYPRSPLTTRISTRPGNGPPATSPSSRRPTITSCGVEGGSERPTSALRRSVGPSAAEPVAGVGRVPSIWSFHERRRGRAGTPASLLPNLKGAAAVSERVEPGSPSPSSGKATAQSSSLVKRLLSAPWKVFTALGILSAVGVFLVDEYGPGVMDDLRRDDPIRVVAGYDPNGYSDGWWMALPSGASLDTTAAELAASSGLRTWLASQGGVDVGWSYVRVAVEGRRNSTVRIVNMRAVVTSRDEPFNGISVLLSSQGQIGVRVVSLDLDEPEAIARRRDETGNQGEPYFRDRVVTLNEGEVEIFEVEGTTIQCYCEWVIELELLVDGEEQILRVDNNGEPFRTTAEAAGSYEASYEYKPWRKPRSLVLVDQEPVPPSTPASPPPPPAAQPSAPAQPPTAVPQPAQPAPEAGLFCRDLRAEGRTYARAVKYWFAKGSPDRMDEDLDGIPCETIYRSAEVNAFWGAPIASGLFCRDLRAEGRTYARAVAYWFAEGSPDRMDEDVDGIPCETVYPSAKVEAYWGL
jgi:hypothetical protein